MNTDLRCEAKKHGVLIVDANIVEIKCDSRWCGARSGVVVLHRFSGSTGELLETLRYADPIVKGGERNGTEHNPDSLRTA